MVAKPNAQEIGLLKAGRMAAALKAYRVRLMVDLKTAMKAFADLDVSAFPTDKDEQVAQLLRQRSDAGDRRDSDACDDIDRELFKLTGDPKYAPDEDEP